MGSTIIRIPNRIRWSANKIASLVCKIERENPTLTRIECQRLAKEILFNRKTKKRGRKKPSSTPKQSRRVCPSCRRSRAECNFKEIVCVFCAKEGFGMPAC